MFEILATGTLIVHLLWLLWVSFGAFLTRGRMWLAALHIASLAWGVVVALAPWPCPLTILEQHLETRAGVTPYQGSFLMHYLDTLVYPDLPDAIITGFALGICALNLAIYARRMWGGPPGPRRTAPSGTSP